MNKERNQSETFFRKPPYMFNCAQSVIKGFENELENSESVLEDFSGYAGGRAPKGICGALYAANYIMQKHGLPSITDDFVTKAGAETCKEIKGKFKFPCIECVRLADYLVEQRLKNR